MSNKPIHLVLHKTRGKPMNEVEMKVKKVFEDMLSHNIITRLDMPIEDYPNYQGIVKMVKEYEESMLPN